MMTEPAAQADSPAVASPLRISETYPSSVDRQLGGGLPCQSSSARRSFETVEPSFTASSMKTSRGLFPQKSTCRHVPCSSCIRNGPNMRTSIIVSPEN